MHFMLRLQRAFPLRPTGLLFPAYVDQPDYIVCDDGKAIGRMRPLVRVEC